MPPVPTAIRARPIREKDLRFSQTTVNISYIYTYIFFFIKYVGVQKLIQDILQSNQMQWTGQNLFCRKAGCATIVLNDWNQLLRLFGIYMDKLNIIGIYLQFNCYGFSWLSIRKITASRKFTLTLDPLRGWGRRRGSSVSGPERRSEKCRWLSWTSRAIGQQSRRLAKENIQTHYLHISLMFYNKQANEPKMGVK